MVAALVAVAFLGGYLAGGFNAAKSNAASQPAQVPTNFPTANYSATPSPQARIAVSVGDSPAMGSPTAPVTMVEFSDFECPFCGAFFSQTFPQVEKNYIDPGKVRFVFKNMPLTGIHPNALEAALAAECANEQGKFWQYHNWLFTNQNSWVSLNSTDVAKAFKHYASMLGLDNSTFNSCLDSEKYSTAVNQDEQDGSKYGVTGTPTFFIGNDQRGYTAVSGAQPFSVFQQQLDSELSG
ncbi:MAG: DsbA family protein [Thaumarchaeota archaeon]|nr:DsbA family protein [Nitrososphaerota archaeon]